MESRRSHLKTFARHTSVLLTHQPTLGRQALLRTYSRVKFMQLLRDRNSRDPMVTPLLAFKVDFIDFDALVFLFEEIFINEDYYFTSDRQAPRIIDCGSNIGLSILYFKMLFPKATVIGFEPDEAAFSCLQRNIDKCKLPCVTVFNYALSERNGVVSFASSRDTLTSHIGQGTTAEPPAALVQSRRLSEFIDERVDFLKLDVQGVEVSVVAELARSGKLELVDQMVIEYHHHLGRTQNDLDSLFRTLGAAGFDYQLSASRGWRWTRDSFQDVLIFAYRH